MTETSRDNELEFLITFLEKTKDGEFAPIEEDSLKYIRFDINREDFEQCEFYVYSIS